MFDLVTVGGVTIDLYYKGDELTLEKDKFSLECGAKYKADVFYDGLGGGAANVAINCAGLAMNTSVIAKIGENSFKQIILQKLIRKRVSTEFLLYDKDYYNISSILLSKKGERTVIHYTTPHTGFNLSDVQIKTALNTKAIYFGHLPGVSYTDKVHLIHKFKHENVKIFLNLGKEDCDAPLSKNKELFDHINVLIVNSYEFASLVKKQHSKVNLKSYLAKEIGFTDKILVVTDAANGSYAYHNNQVYYEKAYPEEKIVDTNGVGDAFTSGFIHSCLLGEDLQRCLHSGNKLASKAIAKIGAN